MSRRLKIVAREMGGVELLLIDQMGDVWESEWAPLQGTPLGTMFPVVSDEVMNHAIRGWTKPLVEALGLPPQGALRKLPEEYRACTHRGRCPTYVPASCSPMHKKMPDCFQPDCVNEATRTLAYEVLRLWHEGVYIVVVKEAVDAYRSYPRV